ncbi:MAG: hypothetical protein RSB39_08570 [Oscillospiraceae bacterium]
MFEIKIGGNFPPTAGYGEATIAEIDASGMLLVLNFNNPSRAEIEAIKEDKPFEIRFTEINNIIMFCAKCGEINWVDAPFNIYLSKHPNDMPDIPDDGKTGLALTLMMVDARNNTIKHMRLIGLGNDFSRELYSAVQRQKQSGVLFAPQYDASLKEIYAKYTTKQLSQLCSARFKLR